MFENGSALVIDFDGGGIAKQAPRISRSLQLDS
jgi:hypothetical protein